MSRVELPTISCYGQYSSNNYGIKSLCFTDVEGNKFYFSYKTLVAFRKRGNKMVITKNYWNTTTGKHLNWINRDKKDRVDQDTFNKLYSDQFGDTNVPQL